MATLTPPVQKNKPMVAQTAKPAGQARQTGPQPAGGFTPVAQVPGMGAPSAVAPKPATWTNTTAPSPEVSRAISRYEGRFDQDNTKRAIDRSNLGIADSAALMAKDARANMASRGVLGSGAGDAYLQSKVFQPAQRAAAGAAANISLGRERDLDQLSVAGTGLVTAPASIAIANQNYNLAQQQAMQRDQMERERLRMETEDRDLARYQALLGMQGGGGSSPASRF